MSTNLEPSFLVACLQIQDFKGAEMLRVKAGLLALAMDGLEHTSAELPSDLTGDSKHIAGCATGALIAQGLIVVTGRAKSPKPDAKGRKLDLWRIGPGKSSTVMAWFRVNQLPVPGAGVQTQLAV